MPLPLMPKATAVWLVENTSLTFEQIGDFCGLHPLEVQGIADDEVAIGIVGLDPVANGQLTKEEIERCSADPKARLKLAETGVPRPRPRAKGARYTPLSKRQDRPDAINWMLKFHPEVSDPQIVKLLGTTKATINAVRDRTHWNASNIKAQDPVSLGICTQAELDEAVSKAQAVLRAREARAAKKQAKEAAAAADSESGAAQAEEGAAGAEPVPEPVVEAAATATVEPPAGETAEPPAEETAEPPADEPAEPSAEETAEPPATEADAEGPRADLFGGAAQSAAEESGAAPQEREETEESEDSGRDPALEPQTS